MIKKESKKSEKDLEMVLSYKRLFKSEDGKRVFYDLCKSCNFHRQVFDPDPYSNAFNCGQHAIVQRLVDMMDISVDEFRHRIQQGKKEDYTSPLE